MLTLPRLPTTRPISRSRSESAASTATNLNDTSVCGEVISPSATRPQAGAAADSDEQDEHGPSCSCDVSSESLPSPRAEPDPLQVAPRRDVGTSPFKLLQQRSPPSPTAAAPAGTCRTVDMATSPVALQRGFDDGRVALASELVGHTTTKMSPPPPPPTCVCTVDAPRLVAWSCGDVSTSEADNDHAVDDDVALSAAPIRLVVPSRIPSFRHASTSLSTLSSGSVADEELRWDGKARWEERRVPASRSASRSPLARIHPARNALPADLEGTADWSELTQRDDGSNGEGHWASGRHPPLTLESGVPPRHARVATPMMRAESTAGDREPPLHSAAFGTMSTSLVPIPTLQSFTVSAPTTRTHKTGSPQPPFFTTTDLFPTNVRRSLSRSTSPPNSTATAAVTTALAVAHRPHHHHPLNHDVTCGSSMMMGSLERSAAATHASTFEDSVDQQRFFAAVASSVVVVNALESSSSGTDTSTRDETVTRRVLVDGTDSHARAQLPQRPLLPSSHEKAARIVSGDMDEDSDAAVVVEVTTTTIPEPQQPTLSETTRNPSSQMEAQKHRDEARNKDDAANLNDSADVCMEVQSVDMGAAGQRPDVADDRHFDVRRSSASQPVVEASQHEYASLARSSSFATVDSFRSAPRDGSSQGRSSSQSTCGQAAAAAKYLADVVPDASPTRAGLTDDTLYGTALLVPRPSTSPAPHRPVALVKATSLQSVIRESLPRTWSPSSVASTCVEPRRCPPEPTLARATPLVCTPLADSPALQLAPKQSQLRVSSERSSEERGMLRLEVMRQRVAAEAAVIESQLRMLDHHLTQHSTPPVCPPASAAAQWSDTRSRDGSVRSSPDAVAPQLPPQSQRDMGIVISDGGRRDPQGIAASTTASTQPLTMQDLFERAASKDGSALIRRSTSSARSAEPTPLQRIANEFPPLLPTSLHPSVTSHPTSDARSLRHSSTTQLVERPERRALPIGESRSMFESVSPSTATISSATNSAASSLDRRTAAYGAGTAGTADTTPWMETSAHATAASSEEMSLRGWCTWIRPHTRALLSALLRRDQSSTGRVSFDVCVDAVRDVVERHCGCASPMPQHGIVSMDAVRRFVQSAAEALNDVGGVGTGAACNVTVLQIPYASLVSLIIENAPQ